MTTYYLILASLCWIFVWYMLFLGHRRIDLLEELRKHDKNAFDQHKTRVKEAITALNKAVTTLSDRQNKLIKEGVEKQKRIMNLEKEIKNIRNASRQS